MKPQILEGTDVSRILSIAITLIFLSLLAHAQTPNNYQTYHNARFNYSISYPSDLLIPQGEAENGDGQKFLTRDGKVEMLVYGSNNALEKTLRAAYQEETGRRQNRTVTYQVLKTDWFVVSGTENDKVFFEKTMLHSGVFKTFRIEYDKGVKNTWDPITAKIARSFKG